MKIFLRLQLLIVALMASVFTATADTFNTISALKAAGGNGDLVVTEANPIYVVYVDPQNYYMLYDGTAGFYIAGNTALSAATKGNVITSGTFHFIYSTFMGYTLSPAPENLVIEPNGTLGEPCSLPESQTRFDRGTYFTAKGTIEQTDLGIDFIPEVGEAKHLTDFFTVGANFEDYVGKTGTFTGVITGTGMISNYSPYTANFFVEEGDEPEPEPETEVKSFRELYQTSANGDKVSLTMPEGAQILKAMSSNSLLVWDGETGLLIYNSYGNDSYLTGFDYDSDAYIQGYTGYAISGTVNAEYEEDYWDFYHTDGNLTIGEKKGLIPVEVSGADCMKEDRQYLFAYVKMHGKMENHNFIADDGTEFLVYEDYATGVTDKTGNGTIKALVYAPFAYGAMGEIRLYPIEQNAWTADASEDDFDAPVMSLAELKQMEYENVRFKFEQDKVAIAAVIPSEGWDQIYLWDGQDGVYLNGSVLTDPTFEAKTGYIVNGGVAATYQGSYSNQLYCNPNYFEGHEVHLTLGAEKDLTPLRKTLDELHATVGTKQYDFSYVAVEGTITNGMLVSGTNEALLVNYACEGVDLNKYEGQTGTFFGLYQATNGEFLLPINENYFLKNDDPIVYPIESLADLNDVDEEGTYNLSITNESAYKVQLLAAQEDILYLWDGQDGAIVFADEGSDIDFTDYVGAFLTGNIKFNVKAYEDSDILECNIDPSSIVFTEIADFLPPVEKNKFNEGDFFTTTATLNTDDEGYLTFTLDGEEYILVDDLVPFGAEIEDLAGKTGKLTAIYAGLNIVSVYPDQWFVEDEPDAISSASLNQADADAARGVYTIDGRRVVSSVNHLTKGVYVVGGKKIVVK